MRVAHRYVAVDGLRTHLLHDGGEGEGGVDTLFLHGAGGSAWTFEATLDALARPGWASADLLGYGESSWLPDGDYSSARQAAHLRRVLDALGVDRLHVVGFSWGGLVGLELADRDRRVDRLVVVDIAPSSTLAPTAVPAIPRTYRSLADATRTVLGMAPGADPAVAERDASLSTAPCAEGFCRKVDPVLLGRWPFRAEDHWAAWHRNRRPTLLVRAEHSAVLGRDEAERMVEGRPDVAFVEVAASGHLVPLEQPAALAAALARFLG